MKKFLLATFFFISSNVSLGQALTEDFSYTVATLLTANGYTSISGGGTNDIQVTSPGLTYSGATASGIGNAITMANNGQDVTKTFSPTINSGNAYASFMINVSAAQSTGDYFFGLYDGAYNSRVYIKSSGAGFVLGLAKSGGTVVYDATVRTFGVTYFIVLKYTFNTGTTSDDVVNLFINPTLGSTEPAATAGPQGNGNGDAGTFDRIAFRQGSSSSAATLQIDGIKVGTSWASVTPLAATATQLAFVNVPGTGTTGNPISSFTVEGRDAGNVLVNSFTGTVTLTKASGSGAINGTLSTNAVAGVATFNNVAFNQASTYTITASSSGLTSATSGNVVVSNPSTNVFGGDGINWVGSNQTPTPYSQPTNCNYPDYRVLKYRKVNTTGATPTDGRGQWVTTINAQASGGDVSTTNMTGGSSNGFVFTSGGGCGNTGTYGNKWNFSGIGSGSLNAINGMQWTTGSGNDMGLNMSTAGKYTFVFKDAGYTSTGYYVGYTANTPVTLTHNTGSQRTQNNDGTTTILATISSTPSAQESFYVRYKTGSSDFSTGSSTISAAGSVASTTVTLSIPIQADGATVYYYIFSSTMSQSALQALSEGDKSYALLNYADNSGSNYTYTALTLTPSITTIVPTTPAISGQANGSGYKGQTITINGSNFQNNATVTFNSVAATSVTFVSATQLTAVVANTGANSSGNVVVTNPTPNTTASSAFNFIGYITTSTGALNTTGNWLGGSVPLANSTVTLNHSMTHGAAATNSPFAAVTVLTGASLTINNAAATLIVTNAFTTVGTGQLSFSAAGSVTAGSVTNAGTLVWSGAGILNISSAGSITNNGTVTSSTFGNVVFAGAGTINGSNAVTFNNLTINGVTTLNTVPTINGTLQINGGNVSAAPFYGTSSTLFYNINTYNRFNEWVAGTTSNASAGYPNNVTIGSSTQASAINLQNSNDVQLGGTLTIGAASGFASSLTLNESGAGTPKPLTVIGNVLINATGTLTLGNINGGNAGDIKVSGNWTNSGTFIPNSRAVFFNAATGDQTITRAAGEIFDYVIISKATSGNVVIGTATPITINQTLTLTKGLVVLAANNLTFGSSGTTASGSSVSYIATTGVGRVIKAHTGSFIYPIGPSTTKYAPVTINNTGGVSQTYTIGVANTTYTPAIDGTNWQWIISTPGTSTSDISFTWSDAGANLTAAAATGVAYRYNGATWDAMGGSTAAGSPNITSVTGISSFANTIWTVALPVAAPATYYNVANSDVSVLTNWGTNTNGTGTNPPSFGTANATYRLYNGTSNTLGTSTTFSGTGTSLVIGDGTNAAGLSTATSLTVVTSLVAANAILTVSSTGSIAISSGSIITVNGIFDDQRIFATAVAYTFTAGAGAMTVNGTFKISGLAADNNVQIGALTGVTITAPTGTPPVGGGTLYIASGEPRLPTTNNYNVIYEGVAGALGYNLLSATTHTVAGNFIMKSGWVFGGNGSTARTLNIAGNLDVQGGELNLKGHLASGDGTGLFPINVSGNVTISGGSLYTVGGLNAQTSGGGTLSIGGYLNHTSGNFGNNNSSMAGSIVFNGGAAQTISTTGLTTVGSNNFTISNTSGGVSLLSNLATVSNLTLTSGTLTVGAFTLSVKGNITRTSGTIDASNASATIAFTGSSAQTAIGAVFLGNVNNLTLNNSVGSGGGLTLGTGTPVTVAGTLLFTSGTITLGANNLTIGSAGTINGAGSGTGFVITNSTGLLVRSSVTSSATIFPVASTALSYTPLTLTNTTGTPNISVSSNANITNAVADVTKVIALQWNVISSSAQTTDITYNWNLANQGGSFDNAGVGELGIYTGAGPYAISSLGTLSGTTISKSGVSLAAAAASNLMVIGNKYAIVNVIPDAPVISAATNITDISFQANWSTSLGADSYLLDVSTTPFSTNATDLFISEYVEGSGSINKYIEIYNGTGSAVNLSDYKLRLYSNGSATISQEITLSGTLANDATIVYQNGSGVYTGTATTSAAVINFNGDDAIALFKISTSANVDIFGQIGDDPGTAWTTGGNTTLDKTLVRKSSITGGVTTNPSGAGNFPTLTTEWDQFNIDDVSHLGSHNYGSPNYVSGYQNLSVNTNLKAVSGLSPNTDYYYRVRAVAGGTSPNSSTITVHTNCPAATISYTIDPCATSGTASVSRTGTINGTYSAPAGLSINSTTGAIDIAASTAGNYTVTYTIAAVNGCTAVNATANVVIKTATWSGNTDQVWTTGTNWSCGSNPPTDFSVVIPTGLSNYPVLDVSPTVRNINLGSGATISINGQTLTINGAVSGTGTITGSSSSNLVIGGTAGTVQFTSGSTNNYLKDFTVNASSSMTIGSNSLNITGGATPGTVTVNGTLNTGGYLVLRSNSAGTARVGNSSGTISGLVTVERHIPARRAWRLLAPPITTTGAPTINASWQEGQTQTSPSPPLDNNPGFGTHVTGGVTGDGFDQSPSNGSSIKYLSGGSWTNAGPTNTGAITDQLAYMLFVRGSRANDLSAGIAATPDETVLRVKGNIKQGPQTMPLAATGFNLVVNPYPSAIDMHAIALANPTLINDNFKIWDPKIGGSNNVGGYVTVSRNGGNYDYAPDSRPSMSGTGSELSQNIQSGSAFFVDAISTGDVNVVESNKSASGSDNVNNPTTPDERMRVNLRSVNADATTPVVDGVLATYDAANTNAINGYDAGKLANFSTENLGMMRDGKELSIERREIIGTRDTIFLNMANMKQKNYQMEMTAQLLNHPNLLGYLEDSYLSTSTLLNLDGNTIYPFNVNATPASAAANRFMIVFKPNVPLPVTFTSIKAVQQANDIAVEWKVDNQTNIKQYEVEKSQDGRSFTNVGTQIATGANGTAATYNWLDVHAVSGDNFYRVKSIGFGGDVQYTRIVKVRMGKGVPAISVYPNPVTDRVVTVQFTDMVKGTYTLNLVNNLGQTVQCKLISHNGANAAQSFAIDRGVAKGNYQLQVIKPGGEKEVMKLVIAE